MSGSGKKLKEAYNTLSKSGIVRGASLPDLNKAVEAIKETAPAKFDETLEVSVKLGVDPRHADQMVRGVANLPHGTGKKVKVAVFAKGLKADEAKNAGADRVGAEDLVEEISSGKFDFDVVIATPDVMMLVGRVGKVLGSRKLMPNPKVGTVTNDLTKAVSDAKAGQVRFRVDKAGIVNVGIGRVSFSAANLVDNFKAFFDALKLAKPSGVKGVYIRSVTLSSTMGPGVKVQLDSM